MSKVNNSAFRSPFFPKRIDGKKSITPRNDIDRKSELDELSKNHASVKINQKIKDFSRIKKAVDFASPSLREDKINSLRDQIKNGTYKINSERIAEKIVSNEY